MSDIATAKTRAKHRQQAAPTVPRARLQVQQAGVTVRAAGTTKFVAAKNAQALVVGDTIRTDIVGRAQVDFSDGSLTRLASSTEYTIGKLTDKQGARRTRGNVTVGETWSRAAKVSESGAFEVRSGGTTAAVEGTAFVFSCAVQTATKVCTVIAVVDTVKVTTPGGVVSTLTPDNLVVVTNDTPGAVTKLTYEDLIKLPWVVENLQLDQQQGKGAGLSELPPPSPPPPPPPPPPLPPPTGAGGATAGAGGTAGTDGTDGTADGAGDGSAGDVVPPPPPPDTSPPAVTLTTPPDGATYTQAVDTPTARYSCADEVGGSGLATCLGDVASGEPLDIASLGDHTFTVTATDVAGNVTTVTHHYAVVLPKEALRCLDDGWKALVGSEGETFTNQGQCVSFVVGDHGTFTTARIVVPLGETLTLSNVTFDACNHLRYGYYVNFDTTVPHVLGEHVTGTGCTGKTESMAGAVIGPFPTAVVVTVFLVDVTCADTHEMDGPHGSVVTLDDASWQIAVMDSGDACQFPPSTPREPDPDTNLRLTATLGAA